MSFRSAKKIKFAMAFRVKGKCVLRVENLKIIRIMSQIKREAEQHQILA